MAPPSILGTFETAGQTGAARIISRILPGKDRALANGIMMSGGSIGAMVLAAAAVPLAPSALAAVILVFLLNMGRASWGAIFLAFNQDIAAGRVGMTWVNTDGDFYPGADRGWAFGSERADRMCSGIVATGLFSPGLA